MDIITAKDLLARCSEALAINYTNQERYDKYIKLITQKYKVGSFVGEKNIADGIESIILGKVQIPKHENEYLYLVVDYTKSQREKAGFITHFGFSKEKKDTIVKKLNNYEFLSTGGRLLEIPSDFVKFEHIMALISNIGKINFRNLKGNELTSIDKDEQIFESIDEKFDLTAQTIRMVFTKSLNGLVITGDPGIGKTYTILQIIKDLGLTEETDYFYVQGAKITLTKFYELMYNNSDKIIIFDDSDSVLQNADGINMLKAALDSNERRTITYESPVIDKMNLPTSFKFTGKCIFISNLPLASIDSAVRSRSLVMDLHMTREEKIERIKSLTQKVLPEKKLGGSDESNREQRQEVQDFLVDFTDKYPDRPKNLDIRTLNKLIELRDNVDNYESFRKLALNQLRQS